MDYSLIVNIVVSVVIALIASSGFWAFLDKRREKDSGQEELLRGLAADRIMFLGMRYIEKGWISSDEHKNLLGLYKPYLKVGGNGTAMKIMEEVNRLPIRKESITQLLKEKTGD